MLDNKNKTPLIKYIKYLDHLQSGTKNTNATLSCIIVTFICNMFLCYLGSFPITQ